MLFADVVGIAMPRFLWFLSCFSFPRMKNEDAKKRHLLCGIRECGHGLIKARMLFKDAKKFGIFFVVCVSVGRV